jgi:hypothetical protein
MKKIKKKHKKIRAKVVVNLMLLIVAKKLRRNNH